MTIRPRSLGRLQKLASSVQKCAFAASTLALLLMASCAGCGGDGNGGGGGGTPVDGITIQPNDTSGASLSFQLAQANGGDTVSVTAGGGPASVRLFSRTDPLNMIVSAKDSESGVQELQIWVTRATCHCDDEQCSACNHPLVSAPEFKFSRPKQQPGTVVPDSSIYAEIIDVTKCCPRIPASGPASGTSFVEYDVWAVAINHSGLKSQTRTITATWRSS